MLQPAAFRKKLLTWYEQFGRHDLPWQDPRDPYRVWISEIMLQQTQVVTVIAYFERFMKRFPNLNTLAEASVDEVLQLWAGLGYYSRARNIHRTAQILKQQYGGRLPADLDALKSLPGIGESTAGAILSSGFNQPGVVLDGNVKRVLIRVHGLKEPPNHAAQNRQLWEIARAYACSQRPADYTQAIMDLGATWCTRKKPACDRCPFARVCQAYQSDQQHHLPVSSKAKAVKTCAIQWNIVIDQNDRVLLLRRHERGIWHRLWCFPEGETTWDEWSLKKIKKLGEWEQSHRLTHRHLLIHAQVWRVKHSHPEVSEAGYGWYSIPQALRQGVPKPVTRFLNQLAECI